MGLREAETAVWAAEGVSVEEQRLPLARCGLDVRVQTCGSGPAVVFIHGASNSGVSWAPLVARLPGFRCVVVDRPGCGLSDPVPEALSDVDELGAFADVLTEDLLDALGLPSATVVGTSFGGFFAVRAAAAAPARIDRLLLIGWSVGAPMASVPPVMRLSTLPGLGALAVRVPPTRRGVRSMLRQVGLRDALASGAFTDLMVDSYIALLRDTDTMANELRAGRRIFSPRRGTDGVRFSPDLLASIAVPTRLIWGESDPFGGAETAEALAAQIPGAELTMVPGGHAPWIDDPDLVADLALAFLT